jgi:membrane-associated phospholipid phosphatase
MFGVMLKSLVMLPTLVPLLLPGPLDLQYLMAVTLPFSIWGGLRIRQWMLDPLNMRLIMAQKIVPYIGPIHMLLAAVFSAHVDAVAAVSFYVCTWFYSQLVNQSLKNTFWRSRPTTSLSEDRGELAARHFPQFKMRLKELPECLESFPSGDSAGAGAFGFCATVFTGNPLWLLVTVAGMFGRVFIHAHHIFDVVIGGSIGVLSAALLDWTIGGWQNCGVKHMLLATAFSFIAHKIVLPRVKAHKMEEHGGGREHTGTRASVFTKERLQGMT